MTLRTLPGWVYDDAEFHALEREHVFARSWQLVGHLSELAAVGDWLRLDSAGESYLVIRAAPDGDAPGSGLRGFHNVCRHRASRLVDGAAGRCVRALRCPYHGWSYDFEGRLRVVPGEEDLEGLDRDGVHLPPVQLETWLGFVWLRAEDDGGPSVARMLAPWTAELRACGLEALRPLGPHSAADTHVDWKNAVDNNLEAYHVPVAHPGLQRLFGHDYRLQVTAHGVSRGGGPVRLRNSASWSERHYLSLLPDLPQLPEDHRRAWYYYSVFPSVAFDVYPDMVDFFQILPAGPGRSRIRARAYGLPSTALGLDARGARRLHAARWLNDRINRLVGEEDVALVRGVQAGLASRSYGTGVLSRREARVADFHAQIRARLPVAALPRSPGPGRVAAENERLLSSQDGLREA